MSERERKLEAALLTVLDNVDYTNDACGVTEMVGAVLPKVVIENAREALATPSASEWNEAIEECARRCSYEKARELRALKCKEQP